MLITASLDLIKHYWEGFDLDFKKVRKVEFKHFGKTAENNLEPIISNRGNVLNQHSFS